ncbi:MAG TPA: hypothetical protein VL334_02380, partial [Anaerolineae bacterium]|nr:hypothetical protein [Anaerolineae bacterium]
GRARGISASPFAVPIRCDIPDAPHFLLEVPANFQAIKAADMPLALQWRLHTRQLFEDAFSQGYTVTDLLRHNDRCHYLLERLPAQLAAN